MLDVQRSHRPVRRPPLAEARTLRWAALAVARGGEVSAFKQGDAVVTHTPRSPRFHQRKGVVVTARANQGEVGVSFAKGDPEKLSVDAWFVAAELRASHHLTPQLSAEDAQ